VIAQDRAKARHEDMPPPLLVSAGSMVLDDQQRPHVLYIDHRMGPGQITHATSSEAGEWSRTPIDAINHVFPEHRPTSMRGSFTRRADGTMYALLELVPHGEGWMNGVPIRAMRRMELDKRLAWLVSRDGGETWDATKALDGGDFNQPNVERPVGGNQPPADTAPPFIYFTGERRYPEEGEVIHNDVYLVMPEMDVQATTVSDAASEPATTPTPYASREAWSAAVPEQYRDHPAFAWPEPDPALPNVLLIGDSISIGYTLDVRRRLQGIANLFRIPDNARSTRQTLGQIETFLGEMRWDVIHFNWGIHDVTLMNDVGETDPAGSPQVPAEQYRDNLERLVRRLKATRAELIWASTTPVASDVTLRDDARIEQYNAIAAELMDRHFVTVNDLRGLVRRADESWWTDGVHFTEAGSSALGRAVAGVILNRLGLRDIQPLLNSEPKRRASPGDESEHFTWTLPLDNPASGRAVRASVAPAADNGPAWTIRTEPDELHLDPGASGELTIHAEADPIRPRYPLPEVVLSIEPDSADRAAERTHATRKRLNVIGAQRPLSIARADRPPQLDGELSDPIWPDAPTVPLFGRMDMQRRITPPTAAWLTYDDDHLYVAYRCDEPEMAAIQHAVTERDGPVYDDDSVELLVSPDATGEPFYHLIVNPNGAVYDARNKDRRVDLDGLRIATGHEAAGWTVEIAVSWTTLGVSKPPDALRMLLARNRQAGGTPTVFQFPISPAGNRMPEQFGIVRLK